MLEFEILLNMSKNPNTLIKNLKMINCMLNAKNNHFGHI